MENGTFKKIPALMKCETLSRHRTRQFQNRNEKGSLKETPIEVTEVKAHNQTRAERRSLRLVKSSKTANPVPLKRRTMRTIPSTVRQ